MIPIYKLMSLGMSLLAGTLAGVVFKQVWKVVSHQDDAPDADDEHRGWTEVLVAATIQGAIFGLVKAAMHKAGATAVKRSTGHWPGDD